MDILSTMLTAQYSIEGQVGGSFARNLRGDTNIKLVEAHNKLRQERAAALAALRTAQVKEDSKEWKAVNDDFDFMAKLLHSGV